MILLLLGCVDLFYAGRVWSCDDWDSVEVYAPGPLRLRDAGPDATCRVSALGEDFPRPDDTVFDQADEVDVVGARVLIGSWQPGFGVTDILLTDRQTDGPVLDLVRIRAPGEGTGSFTWERTDDGRQLLSVECDRCTVRAREVTQVTLEQSDPASAAWVCGVETLDVQPGQQGLVGYHQVDAVQGQGETTWAFEERPTECSL